MSQDLAVVMTSDKSFEEVSSGLEKTAAENMFRVLAVHDVQKTLSEKGFQRDKLKIIEVCNAGFAHEALQHNIDVAMFMPCKFTVYPEKGRTVVSLMRPTLISQMLPSSGLEELAADVEKRLISVMEKAI